MSSKKKQKKVEKVKLRRIYLEELDFMPGAGSNKAIGLE